MTYNSVRADCEVGRLVDENGVGRAASAAPATVAAAPTVAASAATVIKRCVAGGETLGEPLGATIDCGHRPGVEPGVGKRKDGLVAKPADIKRTALWHSIQRELDGIVYPVNQNPDNTPVGPLVGRGTARMGLCKDSISLRIIDDVAAIRHR